MIDDQGRPEPPLTGTEVETLVGFLEFQRATMEWKTRGLDEAGLRAGLAPTDMTLGGLLKHLAYVEDEWFTRVLLGAGRPQPWSEVDWAGDPEWEWHSAAADRADDLRALWAAAVERSHSALDLALARGGLDQIAAGGGSRGSFSARWILVHMIEEYARHNGHADLLRQAIDGATGE